MKGSLRLCLFLVALVLLLCMSTGVETVLADFSHVVRSGETLSSIGRRYGVNPYTIAAVNGLANPNYIRVGQVLKIPSAGSVDIGGGSHHTVGTGETLYRIGRLYGVNPNSIAATNGLPNPNYIRWGQVLTIPSQSGWSNYWQWPGTTTTTPVPPPTPAPTPPVSVCISAEDTRTPNYMGRWVCVEYYVGFPVRDQANNQVFLNQRSPFNGGFTTRIVDSLGACWPQGAEVLFGGRRIRVVGTLEYYNENQADTTRIVLANCGDIQIVQ